MDREATKITAMRGAENVTGEANAFLGKDSSLATVI